MNLSAGHLVHPDLGMVGQQLRVRFLLSREVSDAQVPKHPVVPGFLEASTNVTEACHKPVIIVPVRLGVDYEQLVDED